jgi:hypothetical protein
MTLEALLHQKRDEILALAEKHGARNVRVFGSVGRGGSRRDSDVDFLVDAGPFTCPWFPGGLLMDLRDLLRVEVDVVTENGLKERIRERVLAEAVRL